MYAMRVGMGSSGQEGINSTTDVLVPTAVFSPAGVTAWKQVSAGSYHTCGIASNGFAMCWGAGREHVGGRWFAREPSHSTHLARIVYAAYDL